ncbi:hypothetical protein Slala02_01410 [Streptomyces lavendulae subsp. lavendulae]|nr:hypothetical protein Slala01_64380 [Streptomyces lavendulae subsp. lavendulae]GLX24321.1 hypothetical protein Slala02_01410 [Streptomyces lavendulae subsp. lavendulae]
MARETTEPAAISAPLRSTEAFAGVPAAAVAGAAPAGAAPGAALLVDPYIGVFPFAEPKVEGIPAAGAGRIHLPVGSFDPRRCAEGPFSVPEPPVGQFRTAGFHKAAECDRMATVPLRPMSQRFPGSFSGECAT